MKGIAMKGRVILGFLVIMSAAGLYWLSGYIATRDQGYLVGYMCGNPVEGTLDIEVVIPFSVTGRDPPRLKPDGRLQTRSEWMADHFDLRDGTGQQVRFRYADFADLIPRGKAGTPDFYASGLVKMNTAYTFTYYPFGKVGGKRYEHAFATTGARRPFERARFLPVSGS
jgi:hypothetical protein